MYRKSNGNTFSGKTELLKAYMVFNGDGIFVRSKSDDWEYAQKVQGGSRVYFSKYIGKLNIFKKPLSDEFFNLLMNELDKHQTNLIHPSLENNGFKEEITRLFPNADKIAINYYQKFIKFLQKEFSLDSANFLSDKNYIDDIGPYLLVNNGLSKSVIPELPTIYLAPEKWRKISWSIANHFSGPYPKNKQNINYSWGDFKVKSLIDNQIDEGVVLFLISKFIITQEVWMNRTSCDSLLYFIDLIINQDIKPT